jgi:hypothetical protein
MRSVRINLSPNVFAGQRIAAIDELKGVRIPLVASVLAAPDWTLAIGVAVHAAVAPAFALIRGGAARRLAAGTA